MSAPANGMGEEEGNQREMKQQNKKGEAPEKTEEEAAIHFYHPAENFGCFSNFSRHNFFLNDRRWKTTEHYFQACKFETTDQASYDAAHKCEKPGEAASIGRDRKRPLRSDWEEVKDQKMYDCVKAKFTQNLDCQLLLLRTAGATLVEHTSKDSYWADGGDGTGKNMLGKILMMVRAELAAEKVAAAEEAGTAPETAGGAKPKKMKLKSRLQ